MVADAVVADVVSWWIGAAVGFVLAWLLWLLWRRLLWCVLVAGSVVAGLVAAAAGLVATAAGGVIRWCDRCLLWLRSWHGW